jgi:hypothetical protein
MPIWHVLAEKASFPVGLMAEKPASEKIEIRVDRSGHTPY